MKSVAAAIKELEQRNELNVLCLAGAAIGFYDGILPFHAVVNDIKTAKRSKERLSHLRYEFAKGARDMKNLPVFELREIDKEQLDNYKKTIAALSFSGLLDEYWSLRVKLEDCYVDEHIQMNAHLAALRAELDKRMLPR